MNTISLTPASPVTLPCPIIILGRDYKRKPHASFFPATDTRSAQHAAQIMGMAAIRVENDEVRSFLTRLPQGKLFDSGKAFVPFVKQDLFNEIAAHLSPEDRKRLEQPRAAPETPPTEIPHPVRPKNMPDSFDKIIVGSLVLATEGPLEGWYEAKVVEVKAGLSLRLQWRDYLDIPPFTRRIDQIAIIHPAYVEV